MAADREMLEDMSALLAKLTELNVVSQSAVSAENIVVELTDDGRAYFAILDKFWNELEVGGSEKRRECIGILLDMLVKKGDEGPTTTGRLEL